MKSKKNLIIVIALSVVLLLGIIGVVGNINSGFYIDESFEGLVEEPLCVHSYTTVYVPTTRSTLHHVEVSKCEKCGFYKEGVEKLCTVEGEKGDNCVLCGQEHTRHVYYQNGINNYVGVVQGSGGGEGTMHQMIVKCECCNYTKVSAYYEPCATPCTACGYGVEVEAPVE